MANIKELLQYGSLLSLAYLVLNQTNVVKNEGEVYVESENSSEQLPVEPEQQITIPSIPVTDAAAIHPETQTGNYPAAMDGDGLSSLDEVFQALRPDVGAEFTNKNDLRLETKDLLPDDLTDAQGDKILSVWESVNPNTVSQELRKKNFLFVPQRHLGSSTIGSHFRNANLQLRSEPSNPRTVISPWLNSSIDNNDEFRKELTIGSSVGSM